MTLVDDEQPRTADIRLEKVLYALGDPARLMIVRALAASGEQSCAQADSLDLPKSTRSHHFRILREAGIVAMRKQGIYCLSSVRRTELDARFPGLLDVVLRADRT